MDKEVEVMFMQHQVKWTPTVHLELELNIVALYK